MSDPREDEIESPNFAPMPLNELNIALDAPALCVAAASEDNRPAKRR